MSLTSVREAIAAALTAVTGLRASPYMTDEVHPPAGGGFAMVDVSGPDPLVMAREGYGWTFTVKVFCQRHDERASQIFYDTLRDVAVSTSILKTLEDDAALNALVSYGRVGPSSETQVVTVAGVEYLLVEWPVEVVIQ